MIEITLKLLMVIFFVFFDVKVLATFYEVPWAVKIVEKTKKFEKEVSERLILKIVPAFVIIVTFIVMFLIFSIT